MAATDISTQRAALTAAALAAFLTPFMGSAVNIALPSIGRDFALDAVTLSWVATAYLLAAAVFLLPFGRLADIHGRKRVFLLGLGVYTASSLLATTAGTAAWLIGWRVAQGIGSAMTFGTGVAILTSVYPPNKRGRVLGILVGAVYLGLSLGPFFGGLLTENAGWRSVFAVNVPLGLLVMAVVMRKLKGEWAEARGERFDWTGSIIYSAALFALMYGFSSLPARWAYILAGSGGAGLVVFLWWEQRTGSPVFHVVVFRRNTAFVMSNLAALINYSATFAVTFLLSLYLQYVKGMTAEQAGFVLIAQPVMMAAVAPLAGRLSDHIQPRVVASAGMAFTTLGLGLFIALDAATGTVYIVASLLVLGTGFGLFSSPNTNAIMSSIERRFYGVASATLGTMRLIGQTFSMGLTLLLFALFIGRAPITPDIHAQFLRSTKTAFILFSILCGAGIFISAARPRQSTPQ